MSNSLASVRALEGPVLVIGASGFIGSNILRRILSAREDVVGTVFSGDPWRLRGFHSRHTTFCNIQDPESLKITLNRLQPRTVFDCSAFGAYSFEGAYEKIHFTNYTCLIRLLEYLSTRDISAYIHAGSSSEYGTNAGAPQESDFLCPNSHYAVSKAAASQAIYYFGKTRGFPAVNLRIYSAYGPFEDSSRLIPTLCRFSLEDRLPPFANPHTARDFIHVDDVVEAFIAAALTMGPKMMGASLNIGTGSQTTLSEIAEIAKDVFSIEEMPVFSSSEVRAWDLDTWRANTLKAERELAWKAQIPFREGLRTTRDWWREILTHTEAKKLTKKSQPAKTKNSISAIIACYRDNQAIPVMYARLTEVFTSLGLDYEIIFVNDGSPDDTEEVIAKISAQDAHVIGITHSRNFGSQAAFRSGMELAGKEAVVLLDGDLQDPPELIPKFVDEWRAGADVVYGRRVKREMPFLSEACYKAFYFLFASLSEVTIPKNAGDFSLIDKSVVYWLLQFQERDVFLRGLRAYVGFKQAGIDYVRPERLFGKSTNNWIKNFGWAKKAIFSFTRFPLHLLTAFGAIATLGTLFLALWSICAKLFFPESAPKGITFLSLLIMFFGSTGLLGLGLLGEYIGKIFEETKARPHFIRKHIIEAGQRKIYEQNEIFRKIF